MMEKFLQKEQMASFLKIKEISWTNLKDLKKEIQLNSPFLIKGLVKDWKARFWSFDYFIQHYGNTLVDVQIKEELTFNDEPVRITNKKCTLGSYLKVIVEGQKNQGYLAQTRVQDIHPNLLKDFEFPKLFSHAVLSVTNLWIGPKGTKSKLHYDSDFNLFVQLEGIKRVILISPKDTAYCYPVNNTWYDTYSPIDIENPNFSLYPLFKKVSLYQVHIEPGDALFIPKQWWHDVRSLSNSISLNLWWITWGMFIQELIGEALYYSKGILSKNYKKRVEKNSYVRRLIHSMSRS